jgi:two-component system, LytTR family, response regulator
MYIMVKAILIDDEKNSRESLRKKLETHCPDIQVLAECANGREGLIAIEAYKPHIVFLDIEMPHMNGFTMLQQLTEKNFALIFTTAYNQYAINAIRHSAIDYLVKPVDVTELINAVAKASMQSREQVLQKGQLEILDQLLTRQQAPAKIAVATSNGLEIIDIERILYLEATNNYTYIHTNGEKPLLVSKTLKDFEDILPAELFFRIHNGSLVNLAAIKKYNKGEGGQVVLTNGIMLDVARRRKDELLQLLLQLSKKV